MAPCRNRIAGSASCCIYVVGYLAMTRDASIQRLRCEIGSRLIGRIDRDYVLLGLPIISI